MKVTLNYTKPMINIIQNIRYLLPAEHKSRVKFTNPDLLTELVHYFHITDDAAVQELIKELMGQAGDPWKLYVTAPRVKRTQRDKELVYRSKAVVGGN